MRVANVISAYHSTRERAVNVCMQRTKVCGEIERTSSLP